MMRNTSKARRPGVRSPQIVQAESDAKSRMLSVCFVAGITSLMALGGVVALVVNPNNSKDTWAIIAPLVSAGMAALGYVAGTERRPPPRR